MFAHKDEVKVGTHLRADAGFTCIKPNALLTVEADDKGNLYVPCLSRRHYLTGQLEDDGRYIGLTLEVAP